MLNIIKGYFTKEKISMLLAIDIGNTNIVLGTILDGEIQFVARIATDRTQTEDEYAIELKNILELYRVDVLSIKDSIISSVVPPVFNAIKQAVFKVTGKLPIVVGPGVKNGLNILMDNPAQVGSDLVVNAVAGLKEYKPPLIIVDMGTATTISVVDKNRNYIGGCIMPGVKISLDALSRIAAQLPAISLENPKKNIGKNTIDCMRSGVINGNAAMIDGMILRIEEELSEKATVIATGGVAKFIVPYCKKEIICDENLLLKGLYYIYQKNC